MLGSSPLVAIVGVRDRTTGRNFYEGVLGLKVTSEDPYAVVFDAGGTMLRMTILGDGYKPSEHGVMGWSVTDIRATAAALKPAGVVFERYDFLPQDEDGVWTGEDGTKLGWFKDPDGNVLSVAQFPA